MNKTKNGYGIEFYLYWVKIKHPTLICGLEKVKSQEEKALPHPPKTDNHLRAISSHLLPGKKPVNLHKGPDSAFIWGLLTVILNAHKTVGKGTILKGAHLNLSQKFGFLK